MGSIPKLRHGRRDATGTRSGSPCQDAVYYKADQFKASIAQLNSLLQATIVEQQLNSSLLQGKDIALFHGVCLEREIELCETESEKESLRTIVKHLYGVRSAIVHGPTNTQNEKRLREVQVAWKQSADVGRRVVLKKLTAATKSE